MTVLAIDVGTSSFRVAAVSTDHSANGTVLLLKQRSFAPTTPSPGLVEFDPIALADGVRALATEVIETVGSVSAVAITNQRASTIVWDRRDGRPVGPGLGWQDLRTVFDCIMAKATHGIALAPNQSATKIAWLLAQTTIDPMHLCFGTIDSWLAWNLSGGAVHVTDHSNAAITGLFDPSTGSWSSDYCNLLGIPMSVLPSLVDTFGSVATADALPGRPVLAALVGDQQASLIGQGCVHPGQAKITFGTGGMLDVCTGTNPPAAAVRNHHGTFPIVTRSSGNSLSWGAEGVMLSAGSNVQWLVEDMQLAPSPAETHQIADQCHTSEGVVYVPALLGLGTPQWDYGARGTLLGVTRGTTRSHIVRAVLEGVGHRGADLVDAAQADTGLHIETIRVDGGMSQNPTFVQALANACGRPVEISPHVEATTIGAARLAALAVDEIDSLDDIASSFVPSHIVEPNLESTARLSDRQRWEQACQRSQGWIPDLSALDF